MGLLHLQKYTTSGSGQSKEILQYLDRHQSFYRIEQTVETLLEQTPPHLLSDLLCVSEISELLEIARKELADNQAICFLRRREREDL